MHRIVDRVVNPFKLTGVSKKTKEFMDARDMPHGCGPNETLEQLKGRVGNGRAHLNLSQCDKFNTALTVVEEPLGPGSNVKTLDISGTGMTPRSIQMLADRLKTNTVLTSLNIAYNEIGTEGGKALATALETNKVLTDLSLRGSCELETSLGPESSLAVVKALSHNRALRTLDLSFNDIGPHAAILVMQNKTITDLNVSGNENMGPNFATGLVSNNTLTSLDLSQAIFESDVFHELAKAISTNSVLTHLYLGKNYPRDAPEGYDDVTGIQALAAALQKNKTLVSLDLNECYIKWDGGVAIAKMLKHNKGLTTLNLRENDIGLEGGRAIAEMLEQHNKGLTTLNLGENYIGLGGGRAIAEMLKHNKGLTTLNLSGNALCGIDRMGRGQYDATGINVMASALTDENNTTLTHLDLSFNHLCGNNLAGSGSYSTDGIHALGDVIKKNLRLTMNLAGNELGPDCQKILSEALLESA